MRPLVGSVTLERIWRLCFFFPAWIATREKQNAANSGQALHPPPQHKTNIHSKSCPIDFFYGAQKPKH
jgi:hypothetical protein